jgi:hypothetical protein
MKLYRLTLWLGLLPLMFLACATIAPPQPPSLELPKPPLDLRAARKGDRVILTWTVPETTTDRQTIRMVGPTQVCRAVAVPSSECGSTVAKVAGSPTSVPADSSKPKKIIATYTDTLPVQMESDSYSASATYAIEVFNQEGRTAGLSNQVRVPLARTLPAPADFEAAVTGQGVILSWSGANPDASEAPKAPNIRYVYRAFRRVQGQSQWALVGQIPASGEHQFKLEDKNIEWEKTYEYRAEAVTLIGELGKPDVPIEGDDTPIVTVLAHDIFPPAVPSGLQAVFSGPGQKRFVDLIWAPVSDIDLAGYNVYRHEAGAPPTKISAELVKTPSYRDTTVDAGKQYFYSVSSVDARGNESQRSEETSETVP